MQKQRVWLLGYRVQCAFQRGRSAFMFYESKKMLPQELYKRPTLHKWTLVLTLARYLSSVGFGGFFSTSQFSVPSARSYSFSHPSCMHMRQPLKGNVACDHHLDILCLDYQQWDSPCTCHNLISFSSWCVCFVRSCLDFSLCSVSHEIALSNSFLN